MTKNKPLIAFLIVTLFIVIGAWFFIQSQYVGKKISVLVTKYIQEHHRGELAFTSLKIKFFPPGLRFENLSFSSEDENIDLSFRVFEGSFDIVSSMQKSLTLDHLRFVDGEVSYLENSLGKKQKDSSDFDIKKIKKLIERRYSKSPIKFKKISIENTDINLIDDNFLLNYLSISNNTKNLELELKLSDVHGKKFKQLKSKNLNFDTNLIVSETDIFIKKSELELDQEKLSINGVIQSYDVIDQANLNLNLELKGRIERLHDFLKFDQVGKIQKGWLELEGNLKGKRESFLGKILLKSDNVKSDFVIAEKLSLEASITEKDIVFNKFSLRNNNERLQLKDAFQFYDFKKKKFVEQKIKAKADNLELKNALRYLRKHLSVLSGEISGDVDFILNENDFSFVVENEAILSKLRLDIDDTNILSVPRVKISKSEFLVKTDDGFYMKSLISQDKKSFNVSGHVKDDEIKFIAPDMNLDLEKLGPVVDLKLKGELDMDFLVLYDKKEEKIKFNNSKVFNFELEGFKQNFLSTNLIIDLKTNNLLVSDIYGEHGKMKSDGELIVNLDDLSLKGEVKHSSIQYVDLIDMYHPIAYIEGYDNLDVSGDWSAKASLTGKLSFPGLVVNGDFFGKQSSFFGEKANRVKARLKLEEQMFFVSDINVQTSSGFVQGEVQLDTQTVEAKFNAKAKGLNVSSLRFFQGLPIEMNGYMNANLNGLYRDEIKFIELDANIKDSFREDKRLGNSNIETRYTPQYFKVEGDVFDKDIVFSANNSFTNTEESFVDIVANFDDLSKLIGVNKLSSQLVDDIQGSFKAKLRIGYDYYSETIINGLLNIEEFVFKKGQVNLNYLGEKRKEVEIEDHQIKTWDIDIQGDNIDLQSNGEGNLLSSFQIMGNSSVDASVLELFDRVVSKSSGTFLGDFSFVKSKEGFDYNTKLRSKNVSLLTEYVPALFEDIEVDLGFKDKTLNIEKIKAKLGTGKVISKGKVNFSNLYPKVYLESEFQEASLRYRDKTNISFNGRTTLKGKTLPYQLDGDFKIIKAQIYDEFSELMSKESYYNADIEFLPEHRSKVNENLVNLKVAIKSINDMKIKNSMADVLANIDLNIKGTENDFGADGIFELGAYQNKFFFKGNTYDVKRSNVLFSSEENISNPALDIEASSLINEYKVDTKIIGRANDFDLNLSSSPSLSENDILSLIAFGYTESTSSNLTDEQKSSLRTASVGTLLFEQFKINETLKKELGISLNLGTQITSGNQSFLSQKNATGGDVQVNTATSLEVKKEISKDVELAVSSTIGGTSSQTQKMNLNLNISEELSLEGVFENRTNIENTNEIKDTSVGVDLKYQWGFR